MNQQTFVLDDCPDSHLEALGWQWAYGCFETFLWMEDSVVGLEWHLNRLLFGCSELGLEIPFEGDELLARFVKAMERYPDVPLRVRIEAVLDDPGFFRGGKPPFRARYGGRVSHAEFFPEDIDYSVKLLTEPPGELLLPSPGFKSFNYQTRLKVRNTLQRRGIHEGLVSREDHRVVGGLVSNLFLTLDGSSWVTPPVSDGALTGVTRHVFLYHLPGVEAEESAVTTLDLERAVSLIVTNSILGIQPVSRLFLGNRSWKNLETEPAEFVCEIYRKLRVQTDSGNDEV